MSIISRTQFFRRNLMKKKIVLCIVLLLGAFGLLFVGGCGAKEKEDSRKYPFMCEVCYGKGRVDECKVCHGVGKQIGSYGDGPIQIRICPACNGQGSSRCPRCDGTGKEWKTKNEAN
jgi:hypothetical protein